MQAESLRLRQKLQGALPLVDHCLRALRAGPLLQPQIAPPHYVAALDLLVKSVLIQPNAVQLRRGFSKDHRPDRKQLIYGLGPSVVGIPALTEALRLWDILNCFSRAQPPGFEACSRAPC